MAMSVRNAQDIQPAVIGLRRFCFQGLLAKDPQRRVGWPELLEHPFVRDDNKHAPKQMKQTPSAGEEKGEPRRD